MPGDCVNYGTYMTELIGKPEIPKFMYCSKRFWSLYLSQSKIYEFYFLTVGEFVPVFQFCANTEQLL